MRPMRVTRPAIMAGLTLLVAKKLRERLSTPVPVGRGVPWR